MPEALAVTATSVSTPDTRKGKRMSDVGLHIVLDEFPIPDPLEVIEGRSVRRYLYPVTIVDNLPSAVDAVCGMLTHSSIALITDDNVGALYAEQTAHLFRELRLTSRSPQSSSTTPEMR
jgi:hypothetical protein